MVNLLLLLGVGLSVIGASAGSINEEEGVLVVDTANFDEAIGSQKHILVEFYSPTCGHCKLLKPEYEKAAKLLKEQGSDVRLAKVDAKAEQTLAERFGVKGFPTIFFFTDKSPITYNGGRSGPKIVSWIKKHIAPPATRVASVADLRDVLAPLDVAVVGLFGSDAASSEKAQAFEKAAADSYLPFAIASGALIDLRAELNLDSDEILIVKKPEADPDADYDQLRVRFTATQTNWTAPNIMDWAESNALPTVIVDNSQDTQMSLGKLSQKRYINLIDAGNRTGFDKTRSAFAGAARKLRGHGIFKLIDTNVDASLAKYNNIKTTDVPVLLITMNDGSRIKYLMPTSPVASAAIEKFVEGVVAGQVKPHLFSQPLPADWDAHPVKVVVASTFNEMVLGNRHKKHVFIEFYSPTCGWCVKLAPTWEQLGELMKHRDDVLIAKIDAQANEIEGRPVRSYPTLLLFTKDGAEPINYDGDRSIDALRRFVETDGKEITYEYEGEDDAEPDDKPAAKAGDAAKHKEL